MEPRPAYPQPRFGDDPLLSVREVVEMLGLSPQKTGGITTVRRWCKSGQLEGAVNLGGAAGWKIPRSSVDRFLAKRRLRQAIASHVEPEHGN